MAHSKPSSAILSLSQQLQLAGIDDETIAELLKTSYAISLKKGDIFQPSLEDAMLIYYRSGCLAEFLSPTDEQETASSVWTAGYTTISLPRRFNRFENHNSHYLCLIDAELTVLPESGIEKVGERNPQLQNYLLTRACEYLYTSRDMALLRSSLDKRENIILRLLVLYIRTKGNTLPLTIEEFALLTGTTRQYCGNIIKQLVQRGILAKQYGRLQVLDGKQLRQQLHPQIIDFLSNYMAIGKIS